MKKILIAGFQHETNTFAPSKADWAAFKRGDSYPPYVRGPELFKIYNGINMSASGFIDFAKEQNWSLIPSVWAGAIPSSYITIEAYERISSEILEDISKALENGLDGILLDLHGAAVAEHIDDPEGELLANIRNLVGENIPVIATLDLHANVTIKMLQMADGLVSYRTYPHVDMYEIGKLAAKLLQDRFAFGKKHSLVYKRLPFLIPLNSQSTWVSPAKERYEELLQLSETYDVTLNFCMGFPSSDFSECAPMIWAHGRNLDKVQKAVDILYDKVSEKTQWRLQILSAENAIEKACTLASEVSKPIVIADTQDNPGAGGDSNTTGLLHALINQSIGIKFPQQVAIGLIYDPDAARLAHDAGVGREIFISVGKSVPTYTGFDSDKPVKGKFKVRALSNGKVTLTGAMMTGVQVNLGLSACLEIEGIFVVVVSGKVQLLDRMLLRMVGVQPEEMRIIVVKSSNHFRADFQPNSSYIFIAKAAGPMAADPADLPWRKLPSNVSLKI